MEDATDFKKEGSLHKASKRGRKPKESSPTKLKPS